MTNTYDWNLTPDEESAFIKIKEALHRHPELSLKEFQTTKLIQSDRCGSGDPRRGIR